MPTDRTGGPAFPTNVHCSERDGEVVSQWVETMEGMSLRDYCAAQALPGVLAQWGLLSAAVLGKRWISVHEPMAELDEELAAERAYRYADAMLAEREKK